MMVDRWPESFVLPRFFGVPGHLHVLMTHRGQPKLPLDVTGFSVPFHTHLADVAEVWEQSNSAGVLLGLCVSLHVSVAVLPNAYGQLSNLPASVPLLGPVNVHAFAP
jgi:hypothetical protein